MKFVRVALPKDRGVMSTCLQRFLAGGLSLAIVMTGVTSALAATVSISDAPMANGTGTQIKPNVMFVLDDSGSMRNTFIPDLVEGFASSTASERRYGYVSAACNGVYYNPNITYKPPVKADGSSYPAASFVAAKVDGFDASASAAVVDLRTNFKAFEGTGGPSGGGVSDTAQAAYYYLYTGANQPLTYTYLSNGDVDTTAQIKGKDTLYAECSSKIGSKLGKNVFQLVDVSKQSAAVQQNFANWYSYYRSRMNTMKSSVGWAFKDMPHPENFRVGFSTHRYTGVDSTNVSFQQIADFCGVDGTICDQRTLFYQKLYAAQPGGFTPLRSAMSKIGRMYAGKLLTGANDPVQYSCQQNFLVMATDGFWNEDATAAFNLDGTSGVGDMDGKAARPMFDKLAKPNTLADIAMYYYQTDLRSPALGNCTGALGNDVCEDNVPIAGQDNFRTQHMTTFTLGFGIDGSVRYADDYASGGSVDFNAIRDGSRDWPDPTDKEDLHRVDDLWHAAVNGRGTYFSSKTPEGLGAGLNKALSVVSARTGSGAASATSNLEPVEGDNFAYVASYRTQFWDGDLQARTINLTTGALASEADRTWSAQALLDAKAFADRKIYMKGTGSTGLKDFTSANLATEIGNRYFNIDGANPNGALTQYAGLTDAQKTAATAAKVIDFIRGDTSLEDQTGNATRVFRDRAHVFGDIVSSQPVYVKNPPYAYTDSGYADYAQTYVKSPRSGVVLVGVNDGMLHAFDAVTGAELWAYIPTAVIPYLYRLADSNYANNHRFFVDGSITVGDICVAANCAAASKADWRTIAVVGLGKGGRSYFALDITDTTAPKLLWEFSNANDADLGYSFGNPIITKRSGKWVVLFASGYNNVSGGDGGGRLYVVDATTGSMLSEILTEDLSVGARDTNPARSGLSEISNWVNNITYDDSTQYVYGGDLSGNVWRFDIVAGTATRLAKLGGSGGVAEQAITTRPELAQVKSGGTTQRVVIVGTGKYLGTPDITDRSIQSLYGIRDPLGTTWGDFRAVSGVVKQTLTAVGTQRKITANAVDWSTSPGWFVDFDISADAGERINTDFKLEGGVLAVISNVPASNACNVGGYSYLYFFDYKTGSYVKTVEGGIVGYLFANALGVGMSVIRVNGKNVAIITTSDNKHTSVPLPESGQNTRFKRMMWRELVN